ncbi:dipeptide/oligopeptide/nickel ABC transporter permease/ATP-binding protein [Pseudonocardia sp. ICBG1293]|uniref:dipeptide/oligopeptide/nickel ABC transporter permease/ATP-binding protein n=1 Tax=Pseudonocardia sp. ICBG1293 TaxID=2844382 RepID=UPI001CC917EF|nr:dipeptide/oligopeptide/nickel ABC transporter permease/ATP-binding protein [Pseudonocardia sp. ICBG1293]
MSSDVAATAAPGGRPDGGAPARRGTRISWLLRRPGILACLAWIALVFVASSVARLLALGEPLEQDLANALAGPSAEHPLGTDQLGRDVLDRLLFGGWETLLSAALAVAIAVPLGTTLGLLAGYVGGPVDTVVSWLQDILITLPTILVLLAVATVLGNDIWAAMTVLGVLMSATFVRLVRSLTRSVREELYVDAARVSGLSNARILGRHILPNTVGPVVIQGSAALGTAAVVQAGLGFLGLGAPPPYPSWGGMISEAAGAISLQPWLLVPSGLMIVLTVLALNLLGDHLRDEMYASRHGRGDAAQRTRRHRRAAHDLARREVPEDPADEAGRGGVLRVRDLRVSFPREGGFVDVVSGLDLDIAAGEAVGLVGESGCGKTMTGLSMLGLVPAPGVVSGRIEIDGRRVATHDGSFTALRGRDVALISQEPMVALDPVFTVGSLLGEVLRGHGFDRAGARVRAAELLELVGIPRIATVLTSYPHQLSGGMAQRVSIAVALAGEPRLLVADEPTTALDVTVQAEILELLRRLQTELGMALLFITHDLGVVADICTRTVVMYAGEIVEQGPVEDLFDGPRHPYTGALLAATPLLDGDHDPIGIPGVVPPPGHWPGHCRFAGRCTFAVDRCRAGPIPLGPAGVQHLHRCVRADELLTDRGGVAPRPPLPTEPGPTRMEVSSS